MPTHSHPWSAKDWKLHSSPFRYLRVVLTWPTSMLTSSLLPNLCILTLWSTLVWYIPSLRLTTSALGYLASPLGLLLAFRVNTVISRFHESRKLWGTLTTTTRTLASTLSSCPSSSLSAESKDLTFRYLITFNSPLPPHVSKYVQSALSTLDSTYGSFERVTTTPLSPMYTRHSQRGVLLWLILLPMSLVTAGCGSLWRLLLIEGSVGYIMLGIEEISTQVEQPFGIMPVGRLAKGARGDIEECERNLGEGD